MGLFGSDKKKEGACCGTCGQKSESALAVKILGTGCPRCNELESAVVAALKELGMETAVEHVRDYAQIAAYGVMSMPGLVVDGRVVSAGKVLTKDEAVKLLQKARG